MPVGQVSDAPVVYTRRPLTSQPLLVVQTPTQIEPTKYIFSIENAARIHHMVVFLLPNGA